jgi:hypothetical protein
MFISAITLVAELYQAVPVCGDRIQFGGTPKLPLSVSRTELSASHGKSSAWHFPLYSQIKEPRRMKKISVARLNG